MRRLLSILTLLLLAGCGSSGLDSTVATTSSLEGTSQTAAAQQFRAQGVPVVFRVTGDWGSGFGGEFVITNLGTTTMSGWTLEFDASFTIDSMWNAKWASTSSGYRLTSESWNGSIAPGRSVSVGFNGRPGGPPPSPTNIKLNGQLVGAAPNPNPTPTPTSTPAPIPQPTSTPAQSGSVKLGSAITGDWGSGFGANISIANNGTTPIADWKLRFDLARTGGTVKIDSIWNVEVLSVQGSTVTVGPLSWNRMIAAGAKTDFGFNGSPGGASITNLTLLSSSVPTPEPPAPTPTPSPTQTPSPGPSPSPEPPLPGTGGRGPGLVAYFVEWGVYDRNYHVSNVPAGSVNVLNYAFAQIVNGEVALFDTYAAVEKSYPGDTWDQPLRGNFNQLAKLKARNPQLKTLISVGGWTLSGPFSDISLTQASREKLARSAVAFIRRYGFDGVDIDWEYPVSGGEAAGRPADKANYTLLLQELRRQLDAAGTADGKRYYLSIAAPAGFDKLVNLELARIGQTVDWINVMTYDYHGSWERTANHHAPLYRNPQDPTDPALGCTVEATISAYLQAGVPPEKVVLGIPAYGRSWSGTQGLFQVASGPGPGSFEAGVFDYKDLVARKTQQPAVYQRIWDAAAQAPVLLAPSLNRMLVSYEDEVSLAAKIGFARDKRLGGFLLWELSGDVADPSRPESLVGTIERAMQSWP